MAGGFLLADAQRVNELGDAILGCQLHMPTSRSSALLRNSTPWLLGAREE